MTDKNTLIKVMVDTVKNPQRLDFSAEGQNVDERIRQELFKVAGVDLNEKITRYSFEKAMERNGHVVFAILEEVINQTFLQGVDENELYRQFAEIRNVSLGDAPSFYMEDDGIITVSEISNGNWDIHRQKLEGGQSFTIETKEYGAKMYQDFFAFALGRLTFQTLVTKVAQGFDHHLSKLVAGAFQDTIDKLPTELKATGSYDEAELMRLVTLVEAVAGSAVVVGTRAGLAHITAGADVQWLTEEQKANKQRTGNIGYYNGMTLVQLPQLLKDGTFDLAYDDKMLMILPASEATRPIKVVVEGEGMIRNSTVPQTNQDQTLNHTYTTRYGVNVIIDSAFALYEITK